jgi:hypothetical protein
MKKNIIIVLLIAISIFIYFRQKEKNYYDMINAVSGATPLAIARDVPEGVSLTIDGLVKKEYRFSTSALNGFATMRIRTKEFSQDGKFLGAYAYTGIPVFNILEGIAPQKPKDAIFDQPLDILITFTSSTGETVRFSYNEIIMSDDRLPLTLAYHREPVQPTSDQAKASYKKNLFSGPLTGLKLIAPGEPDVTRYLDNVIRITYTVLPAPDDLLPARQKGLKCAGEAIACIEGQQTRPASFQGVKEIRKDDWTLIGHGKGYEETVDIEGFELRSFLQTNFKEINPGDYFLFVACDGYRCLFSWREIFVLDNGKSMMIVDKMNGKRPATGFRLALTNDFFADRSTYALAYVVRIIGADAS